jgi:hypothetical protein
MLVNRFALHTCWTLLLLGGALSFSRVGQGQEQQPAPGQSEPTTPVPAPKAGTRNSSGARSAYSKRAIDNRVRQFAKALDLDETQQAGLKAVLERQQLQTRQLQFDSSISGDERIGRFRALQDDTVLRIRALLNDEQKKKYDPLNHSSQDTSSSGKYLDQWMKNHQHASAPPQSTQK